MPITNKKDMYECYERGDFGNKLRSWSSVDAFLASKSQVYPVGLRYAGAMGGAQYPEYSKNRADDSAVRSLVDAWVKLGADRKLITVNETSNDELLLIQGEIIQSETTGYSLTYSTAKLRMREALKSFAKHHMGPGALLILKDVMTPASYDDLLILLKDYPGHAIEFSTFSKNTGCLPRRNTLIWECRLY